MAYMNKYQSDDYRRDELIRIIEHSVEKLTLQELEALYFTVMAFDVKDSKVLNYMGYNTGRDGDKAWKK